MGSFYASIAVACVVIIILLAYAPAPKLPQLEPRGPESGGINVEGFDTWRNHDDVSDGYRDRIYGSRGVAIGAPPGVVACAGAECSGGDPQMGRGTRDSIINRYTWSEVDAAGDNIYDKVYMDKLERQWDGFELSEEHGDGYVKMREVIGMMSEQPSFYFNGELVTLQGAS